LQMVSTFSTRKFRLEILGYTFKTFPVGLDKWLKTRDFLMTVVEPKQIEIITSDLLQAMRGFHERGKLTFCFIHDCLKNYT